MATARPFAFNTGSTISGSTQLGDLGIGVDPLPWCNHIGGVTWYMGADEELGYIIARPNPSLYRPRFLRAAFTEQGFLDLCNYVSRTQSGPVFTNTLDAKNWIDSEGYWTTYTGGTGPTPTPTPTQSVLPTPSPTPTPTITPTITPTPSSTPPINFDKFSIDFSGTTIYNLRAGDSFVGGDNSEWTMDDTNTYTTVNSSFNHVYESPYLEPVEKHIEFVTDDLSKLDVLYMYGLNNSTFINKIYNVDLSNITGSTDLRIYNTEINDLDLSTFTGMSSTMYVHSNPYLVNLTLPTMGSAGFPYMSSTYIYSNPLITELDLSGFNKIQSLIQISSNVGLENIIFPASLDAGVGAMYNFGVYSNSNLAGELDVSMFTKMGQDIKIYGNSSVTSIKFPVTIDPAATDVRRLDVFSNTSLTGQLDVSMFEELGGYVQIYSNGNLTGITFADTLLPASDNMNTLSLRSNDLTDTLDLSMFTKIGTYTYIYGNPNLHEVIFPATIDGAAPSIVNFQVHGASLTTLDVSMFTKMGGLVRFGNDPTLTGITFPGTIVGNNITNFEVSYTDVMQDLDISPVTKLGATLNISQHDALTGITFPATIDAGASNITTTYLNNNPELHYIDLTPFTKLGGQVIMFTHDYRTIDFPTVEAGAPNLTYLALHNPSLSGLTGNQDLSGLTKLCGNISMYGNSLLTGVTFPATLDAGVTDLTRMSFSGCDLHSLDLTMFTKARSVWQSNGTYAFNFNDNTNLTSVQFPEVLTGSTLLYFINRIYFGNCALDETSVDDLLAKMLTFYTAVTPVGGACTVTLDGGTNSPPSAQGLTDIGDLETIFTNAGLTLTITVNT